MPSTKLLLMSISISMGMVNLRKRNSNNFDWWHATMSVPSKSSKSLTRITLGQFQSFLHNITWHDMALQFVEKPCHSWKTLSQPPKMAIILDADRSNGKLPE
jgi:hypothetical protein